MSTKLHCDTCDEVIENDIKYRATFNVPARSNDSEIKYDAEKLDYEVCKNCFDAIELYVVTLKRD